ANACSSWFCDTLVVDSNGIISNIPVWYDCLGVMYGNAVAGTPCTTFLGLSGEWNADCVCIPDSMNTGDDCLGIPNGPNVPGTPCIVPGTTLDGLWNTDCVCVPDDPMPCQADFWVMQAMGQDSLPVPYELWIWNLSSGGSGNFQYFWDFGDGTNSTEAFPTHTYSGNGPYTLCLTIADNQNCTSTHCDSISINGDGIYEGMMVHDEVRQEGFTINVQNGAPSAVPDVTITNNLALWPNPVADELNIAIAGGMKGMVTVTVTDMDGRTVSAEGMTLAGGRGQLRIATGNLPSGMYMLRISNGSTNLSQRFVKTN
ncbi:MAG TPA: PKD domain-containing protein, partial [Flavobacteriales bacterium]|nr:PKD domain-containing protein [Flavobacteriales bacterium]